MPIHIKTPTQIKSAGNKPKIIREFIGRVNSKTDSVSIARMTSPSGWVEPGQKPEFDEYTLVLKGSLIVVSKKGTLGKRSLRRPASGSSTARRAPKARNMWLFAFRRSRWTRCIGTHNHEKSHFFLYLGRSFSLFLYFFRF